ncbi:breast cancer anti-estrogen resistance protein 3 homolog [Daktulosphaira vitifoliae]|uniref:breast cancer anti-estrogen resistance protein 3 homolog n=1 Tax=Daktulosphaira vitifoliae TaxID=58002 RepID=UPI0021A9FC69|nr:breast cancer anti-estrogen resistance protein 3 homolog [Daktulosphaira vitifoliae]
MTINLLIMFYSSQENIESIVNTVKIEKEVQMEKDHLLFKKTLEWEMSLDARDLRSHAWYHGSITRSKAEELLIEEFENDVKTNVCLTESIDHNSGSLFLVRDCTTQLSNYVLSCLVQKINGNGTYQILHFVINKIVLQADTVYEHIQYRFEQDSFDTVPDLITFYVGSGQPISCGSLVRIRTPCNRKYPLTVVENIENNSNLRNSNNLFKNNFSSSLENILQNKYPIIPPENTPNNLPPKLPAKQAVNMQNIIKKLPFNRNTPTANICISSTNSLPRESSSKTLSKSSYHAVNIINTSTIPRSNKVENKVIKDSLNSNSCITSNLSSNFTCSNYNSTDIKMGSSGNISNIYTNYPTTNLKTESISLSDLSVRKENESNDGTLKKQLNSNNFKGGVLIKHPLSICNQSKELNQSFMTIIPEGKNVSLTPSENYLCSKSLFSDLDNFQTLLLPSTLEGNKPLDDIALEGVHLMIQDTCSRVLANHLTYIDLSVTLFCIDNKKERSEIVEDENTKTVCKLSACSNGENKKFNFTTYNCPLELCLLPNGHRRRLDLIERNECIKLLVAITILTCKNLENRVQLLDKWIQVAIDLKTALGNLYGFSSIMSGLCDFNIQRLNNLWLALRKNYTDSAFNFEAKLRPQWLNMNRGINPQAPNTTIPHLMPIIWLHEKIYFCNVDYLQNQNLTNRSNLKKNIDSNEQKYNGFMKSMTSLCNQLSLDEISSYNGTHGENASASLNSINEGFELQTLLNHMQAARSHLQSLGEYRRNADTVLPMINLSPSKSIPQWSMLSSTTMDQLLLDLFSTEFLLKFLWGSKAMSSQIITQDYYGNSLDNNTNIPSPISEEVDVINLEYDSQCIQQRHVKFKEILHVMSEKCEIQIKSDISVENGIGIIAKDTLKTAV